jgi:phosphonate transport system substrate-binding protein
LKDELKILQYNSPKTQGVKMKFLLRSIVFLLIMVLFANASSQQTASDGTKLAGNFGDADKDLLADPEQDPRKWVDPTVLIFGYTENQALYQYAREALAKHIEQATGKKVRWFRYRTNAAQLEAMRTGMVHIVGLNTGSVPVGVRCSGFRLFSMAAKSDGRYGYTMQIITYPGSGIDKTTDLKGKKILFTSPTSNSGYKAPKALLSQRYNLSEGLDYRVRFSGSHEKSIIAVAHRKAKIATIANGVLNSMISSGKISPSDINIIYTSQSFPGTGYGYPYNLKPQLAKKIEKAFFDFRLRDSKGKLRDLNRYHDALFIPAEYREKWSIVRDIDLFANPDQSCR